MCYESIHGRTTMHGQPHIRFSLFDEVYKWWRSSLCNFLQSPVTSSLLHPSIFLATCSRTPLTYFALSLWKTKFHTHVKQPDVFSSSINHYHSIHSCLIKVRKQIFLYFVRPSKTKRPLWNGMECCNITKLRFESHPVWTSTGAPARSFVGFLTLSL